MIACSFVSADDAFGGSHEFQEDLISIKKLNMLYKEIRTVVHFLIAFHFSRKANFFVNCSQKANFTCETGISPEPAPKRLRGPITI